MVTSNEEERSTLTVDCSWTGGGPDSTHGGNMAVSQGVGAMDDPCAFSPNPRHAEAIARFYTLMFSGSSKVLDVGFGEGYFLRAARANGLDVFGIDRDVALVDRAKLDGFSAMVGDICSVRGIPGGLDGIVATHLIEHLVPDDVRSFLRVAAAHVRPGGCLVLSTPNLGDLRVATRIFWQDPTHIRPYPPEAVEELMDRSHWEWEADGFEPRLLTRRTPLIVLNRLRFGLEYGKTSRWYRLRRKVDP